MKSDTATESLRMKMFTEMQRLNWDVHMYVTQGQQEKKVDIALAIDMLHYATVPGKYNHSIHSYISCIPRCCVSEQCASLFRSQVNNSHAYVPDSCCTLCVVHNAGAYDIAVLMTGEQQFDIIDIAFNMSL
jgi:hypothetical protein